MYPPFLVFGGGDCHLMWISQFRLVQIDRGSGSLASSEDCRNDMECKRTCQCISLPIVCKSANLRMWYISVIFRGPPMCHRQRTEAHGVSEFLMDESSSSYVKMFYGIIARQVHHPQGHPHQTFLFTVGFRPAKSFDFCKSFMMSRYCFFC